jgi:hypothetical protein
VLKYEGFFVHHGLAKTASKIPNNTPEVNEKLRKRREGEGFPVARIRFSRLALDFDGNDDPGDEIENGHGDEGGNQGNPHKNEPDERNVKIEIISQAGADAAQHFLAYRTVKFLRHGHFLSLLEIYHMSSYE